MSSKKAALLEFLNNHAPHFVGLLGGKMVDFDEKLSLATFEFNISKDYCHSVDVVQGGFITSMLDTAMSHAVMAANEDVIGLSSLEIKTSYLEPTRAGKLRAEGWVVKGGYKTGFLEGRLYNEAGQLTATASTVAKIVRKPRET
ncbi:MAG: PaaI family thioesterase [Cellvibrionaceae bacterium]